MTTLHDRTSVQIKTNPVRTEKYINKQYNSTFRHTNSYQRYQTYDLKRLTRVSSTLLFSKSNEASKVNLPKVVHMLNNRFLLQFTNCKFTDCKHIKVMHLVF